MLHNQTNKKNGDQAEDIATNYLIDKGYGIVKRNYRYKRSEIDIITIEHQKTLVFVEVKYRSNTSYGTPETFVSDNQKTAIIKAAEEYILNRNWEGPIRFDIIALDSVFEITHFEDAFY